MNISDTINGYTIKKKLGEGGFGIVYRAEKNGQCYALKTLKANADQETKQRFSREVRLLGRVHDEHVIELIEFDLDINPPYYIMPLCDESLEDKVCAGMSDEDKYVACLDFCKGIQAIHNAGIFHRDIKPSNALYLNGVLKITDLGLGRFENRDTTTLTRRAFGSEGYYPPEFASDPETFKKGTRQGDIYMIGKTLYFVMSNGGDVSNVDISQVEAGMAPIILRCLKPNLNERYNSVDEVINELLIAQEAHTQLQQMPKPIEDILNMTGQAKFDELYKLLLQESHDNKALANLLKKIGTKTFAQLFAGKENLLNNYIGVFEHQLHEQQGFIYFEDVEVYVEAIKAMFSLSDSPYYKQILLDLALDLSIQYNRFSAVTIVGKMLGELSDSEARALSTLFVRRKEDIKSISPNFTNQLHYIVRNLIR